MTKSNTILIISMSIPMLTREKHTIWKGKLTRSKEIEGDTALTILRKLQRLKAMKMKSPTRKKSHTTPIIEITTEMNQKIKIKNTEMMNPILKMLNKVLESIELEKVVEDGRMSHRNIRMIISDMRNIHNGERTGALGLEQKPSEVTAASTTDLTDPPINMITKVLTTNNPKEDKFTDPENLEKVSKMVTKKKITMMIPVPIDKSLIPKLVNQ